MLPYKYQINSNGTSQMTDRPDLMMAATFSLMTSSILCSATPLSRRPPCWTTSLMIGHQVQTSRPVVSNILVFFLFQYLICTLTVIGRWWYLKTCQKWKVGALQAGTGTVPTCVLSHSVLPSKMIRHLLHCKYCGASVEFNVRDHLLLITTGRWHHFRFRAV